MGCNPSRHCIEDLAFPAPDSTYRVDHSHFFFIKNVPCMMYKASSKFVILYSHGNSCDIGQMHPLLETLSKELNVNIISYDYPGYGVSVSDRCSEVGCIESIDTVFAFLLQEGFLAKNIILYGVSIGTGPSVDIASRFNNMKALLLQSPFTSAVGVQFKSLEIVSYSICPKKSNPNIFRNIEKIGDINIPIIILHGTHDTIVSISHSEHLVQKNPNIKLVKIQYADHNDIKDNVIFKHLNEIINN
jgi:pimeloyl-ACP methyl ester carboxylesterase